MSCSCHEHHHDHQHGGLEKIDSITIIAAVVITGLAVYLDNVWMFLAAYAVSGYKVVWESLKNIAKGEIFDENFLMSIATIGAIAIGDYFEAVAVMIFFRVGEYLQELSVARSRKSITALMDIRPDYVNLKTAGGVKRIDPKEAKVGDLIVIKPGERVPLDCIITEGSSAFDTSALTGESALRDCGEGEEILSGFVCSNGLITAKVTKEYGMSTISKILELTQNAYQRKTATENFITKFAKIYTPIVCLLALLIAVVPPLVTGTPFSGWIYRALVFLVISCPCALVISVPLSFFSGIGKASKSGVLVKGSSYLEALTGLKAVVFDKTGTLTEGRFAVSEIHAVGDLDILHYTAYAEHNSSHPIAVSIVKKYGKDIDQQEITELEEISGYGIHAVVSGKQVFAGNEKLMQKQGLTALPAPGTAVHIAIDGVYAGYIALKDQVKPDSKKAIQGLAGYNTYMLTGDNETVGKEVAGELGIGKAYFSLLPQQKTEILEQIKRDTDGKVAFVGDGINDAPSLATADIGIAMGGIGSDAAIDAADVVIMNDNPAKLVTAIKIARDTKSIVIQNIVFSLAVKAVVLILGALGIASMWWAVFADVGVTLIAVLNAMRLALYKYL